MRLFTKILFAYCLFIQTHPASAEVMDSMTPPDADAESSQVMKRVKELFKAGESIAIHKINGLEGKRNDMAELEVETAVGKNPLICVEKDKEGKLIVLASRRGAKEIGSDISDDKTHQAIVAQLETKKSAAAYYTDKSGRQFELLAVSFSALTEQEGVKNVSVTTADKRCAYCATEAEVTKIPDGAVVIK
ncbi:MAG: hypothetical protein K2W94_06135 [Alphaproteobacteria bacterium]|nr:hypothetical protein [Alphaproteobacteria bacterium]